MRKFTFFVVILILVTGFSCKLIQQEVEFPLKYTTTSVLLDNNMWSTSYTDTTAYIVLNLESYLEERDTRYNLIEEVKAMGVNIKKSNNIQVDFGQINISVKILSEDGKTNFDLTRMVENVTANSIYFYSGEQDIVDIFQYEKCRLVIEYQYGYQVAENMPLDVELFFDASAIIR